MLLMTVSHRQTHGKARIKQSTLSSAVHEEGWAGRITLRLMTRTPPPGRMAMYIETAVPKPLNAGVSRSNQLYLVSHEGGLQNDLAIRHDDDPSWIPQVPCSHQQQSIRRLQYRFPVFHSRKASDVSFVFLSFFLLDVPVHGAQCLMPSDSAVEDRATEASTFVHSPTPTAQLWRPQCPILIAIFLRTYVCQ